MQVTRTGAWKLQCKTKSATVNVSDTIEINGIVIDGPGEYDVAGVSVQGMASTAQTIFVINIEDVCLCVVPREPLVLDGTMLEQIGSIDIAVVPVTASHPANETTTMVNLLEPQMVFLIGDGDVTTLIQGNSLDAIKVTKSSLPTDSREIIALTIT